MIRFAAFSGLGRSVAALAASAALLAASVDTADAQRKRQSSGYSPPGASIVVDANSGQVLQQSNPDALRHPASLTKVMTLYLLFERLEANRIELDTELPVSANAARQAPSKLGLRAGQTISVEEAIRALVTKSANDAAVVVAEALADDEDAFARQMTRKARALGMSRTVYRNASGLPNPAQVTTARDQALLGRAIQDRFPRYYRYFASTSFRFNGVAHRNHNRLLGRVEGIDGIKTGYTRASGFNLISSVRRDNRHLVAVVLGGSSAGARDARMRALLEDNIMEASVRRTAPRIGETRLADADDTDAAPVQTAAIASNRERTPDPVPQRTAARTTPAEKPAAGSTEPIRPTPVRTVAITARPAAPAAPAPRILAAMAAPITADAARTSPRPPAPVATPGRPAATASHDRGGFVIQVGAFPNEQQARNQLKTVQAKAGSVLGEADPFTERVQRGSQELFRARFAGLDRATAERACQTLQRSDIACMTLRAGT